MRERDRPWASTFESERDRLQGLEPAAVEPIDHIGSTAIPGLAAKPVIDSVAGVALPVGVDEPIERLRGNGHATSAEFNASLSNRKLLMR